MCNCEIPFAVDSDVMFLENVIAFFLSLILFILFGIDIPTMIKRIMNIKKMQMSTNVCNSLFLLCV